MASEAFAGVGTKFQRWDGAAWQDIAEVNSIDGPGMTKDVLEVTSLDTDAGYNEFITGFAEGGTVTLDMNFTRETYELMKDDFESDVVQNYRIQLADYDSEPSTFTFGGLVIELPMGISADDKVTADVVIQVTSQVVLDIGSTVPAEEPETPPVGSSDYDALYAALDDGNTVALLLYDEGVTVENTDEVVAIANLMGSSAWDVVERADSTGSRPTLTPTGILFDGVDDLLAMSGTSALSQPNSIYFVYKIVSFITGRPMVSFNSGIGVDLRQYGTGGRIRFNTSSAISITTDYSILGERAIAVGILNGASSSLKLNSGLLAEGDLGTRTINELFLGCNFEYANKSNYEFVGLVIRNGVDNSSKRQEIWNALNDLYVHNPISGVVEDATPLVVDILFHEELDEGSLSEIDATDFAVTSRTVSSLSLSADKKTLHLTLTIAIDQAWSGQVIFTQSSAGGILTAGGDPVPYMWLPITNNVID